jgi:hypothetical protein
MQLNTTGTQNTAVGMQAMISNTTGNYNVAIGGQDSTTYPALYANTTGASNVAVGNGSLGKNTTGGSNTAVGYQAAYTQTNGTYNVALGQQALYTNSGYSYNTAIGYQALYATSQNYNTAVGYRAGYTNTTGIENTFIGQQAGYSTTGSDNTYVGVSAGYAATSGIQNTFIGYASGTSITTGSKNVILGTYSGNQGGLDIRTASNYIVLSDGDGNPRGIFNNNGQLLVGKTGNSANGTIELSQAVAGSANLYMSVTTTSSIQQVIFGNPNGTVGSISTNASLTLYNTTSDYRLKNVIGAVLDSGTRIDMLEPVEYDFKAGGRTRGFLAHKFAEVYPTSVSGEKDAIDADGKPVYQSMQASSSEVMADLIAEIQSLRKRVSQLESK